MPESRTNVELWFDPRCPWAWITSRWLLEVAARRPIDVDWHLMSLHHLNAGKVASDDYRTLLSEALASVRVCAAATEAFGRQALLPLYSAMGRRFHRDGRRDLEAISEAIAEVGLPTDLLRAAASTAYDEAIEQSHRVAVELVGPDLGTPVLSTQGVAIFGPVVGRIPRGESALRLWDGLLLVAGTDDFFELKRSRNREPAFD
jgi:protein-disulfide isomerase-like protein with CxxC motif